MNLSDSELDYPPGSDIGFWLKLLNSFFKRAKVDISISELAFYREEVVIGFPQIESLENELTKVKTGEDFIPPARYLAIATIKSGKHEVSSLVRFYLTSDRKLKIEDSIDDGATLHSAEEAKKPALRERVVAAIKAASPWLEFAVKWILLALGVISNQPK